MKVTRRQLFATTGGLLLGAGLPALARGVRVIGGPAFGSSWRAIVPDLTQRGVLQHELQGIVNAVDRAMSPFRADSAVTRFNNSPSTDWIAQPPENCAVLGEGLRIARFTMGAFDPTVGAVVGRYGFGPLTRDSAGSHSALAVRSAAVRKAYPGMSLDLCGIAKGYALDRMADAVAAAGAGDFLIELGGEVFARGRHPGGRPWQAGIESPDPGEYAVHRLVRLDGEALATSGDRVNSYRVAGRRYCHIIDPRSRRPADNRLAGVSVLAPVAATADALATALFVMGEQAGVAFARREAIAALFVRHEESGFSDVMTGGFAAHVLA